MWFELDAWNELLLEDLVKRPDQVETFQMIECFLFAAKEFGAELKAYLSCTIRSATR